MKQFFLVASLALFGMNLAGGLSPAFAVDETMTEKADSAGDKASNGDVWGAMHDYHDANDEAAKPDADKSNAE